MIANTERYISRGLHNFTHPRTDGVAIMVTVDETGDRILLGRGVGASACMQCLVFFKKIPF